MMEVKKPQTMREWLDSYRGKFEEALPKNTIDAGRFITAAALEITNDLKLQKCDKASLLRSLLDSARYGLEVGRLLGQAWLIPYNETRTMPDGSRQKVMTCHFQLGYKGLIVLARRSNTIKTITAEIVYENDIIDIELGEGRRLTHKINIREDRGEPIAYYCLVELVGGGTQWVVMTKRQIENFRDRYSKAHAAKGEDASVWDTNFDEMALKTVVIRTLKLCPISIEALEATKLAELQEATGQIPMRNVTPDNTPAPPDTPVMIPAEPAEMEAAPQEEVQVPAPQEESKKTKIGSSVSAFERDMARIKENAAKFAKAAEFPAAKPAEQTPPEDLAIF